MKVNGKKSSSFAVCIALIIAVSASVFADSTYIVKKGDTLYSISRRYELTVAELRTANNLSENDVLQAGQKLTIPSADITNAAALSAVPEKKGNVPVSEIAKNAETYTVQKGDTLYSIARRYDIKLYDLLSINNMANDAVIKVGQHIKVPAKSAAVAKIFRTILHRVRVHLHLRALPERETLRFYGRSSIRPSSTRRVKCRASNFRLKKTNR